MSETLPDVEGWCKALLRADAGVAALVGTRVFLSVPAQPVYPLVSVLRVGGGDDGSEAPIDQALVQIDCWGAFDVAGHPMVAQAAALANAVRAALFAVRGRTTAGGVDAFGADTESMLRLFDPGDGRVRYSITAAVTAIGALAP